MRARRVDRNQGDLIRALRKLGVSIQPLHTIGQGCPDVLAGFRGTTVLLEIKDGEKAPSRRKTTKDQDEWISKWRGAPVHIVRTLDEALEAFGL